MDASIWVNSWKCQDHKKVIWEVMVTIGDHMEVQMVIGDQIWEEIQIAGDQAHTTNGDQAHTTNGDQNQ